MKENFQNLEKDFPDYMSICEVAQILGKKRQRVWFLVRVQELESIKVGHQFIIPKNALIKYLKKERLYV